MYNLPFGKSSNILEIGGGTNPFFRPNLDVREGSEIDIVADINKTLPIASNKYDGVFCRYAIEHISWREIRGFISEVYRVLAPGKSAFFVTADLLEQARILSEVEEFDDKWVCMVFGDNDYPENTHRCGFSPEFAGRLFQEAGFERVIISRHPDWRGDMTIEATKPTNNYDPKDLFDMHYFHGGAKVGGYAREGYRDFPVHWVTSNKILAMQPTSVLELGCARGYVIKKIEDYGVMAKGLEVSHHCYLTRATDSVIEWDICKTPWPFADNQFDLCYSVAVMEHIPEEHLQNIINEICRVSKRSIHGVDFGANDDGFDQTHCTLKERSWWLDKFAGKESHDICDKEWFESYEGPLVSHTPAGDNQLKLNVGSHIMMFHNGWVNIDILPLQQFAASEGYKFLQHDSTQPMPFVNESVDLIYSSHFVEHLTYEEAVHFFTECKRIMKPRATMRVIVPDLQLLVEKYANGSLKDFDQINVESSLNPTDASKLWNLIFNGHKAAYDFTALKKLVESVGLKCERRRFREGNHTIISETIDSLPCLSLYVEISK